MKMNAYQDIQKIGGESSEITNHLGLVRRLANHLRPRIPGYIELDDMIQLGTMALIEAEKKYDPSLGISFENFAKTRIRGAIIDEARRFSDVSRLAIKNSKAHSEAAGFLANQLGRKPSNREVAESLGITIEAFEDQRTHANQLNMLEYDLLVEDNGCDVCYEKSDVFDLVAEDSTTSVIAEAIGTLDERKQLILQLYYVEEMNLKEIGAVIGVNESRISQILSSSVKELRPLLETSYRSGELT